MPTIIQRIDLNTCALCNQTFRLRVGLKRHMRFVHGCHDFVLDNHKKIFCKYCEFSSYKEKAVETHTFLGLHIFILLKINLLHRTLLEYE